MLRAQSIQVRLTAAGITLAVTSTAGWANQSALAPASDLAERVWWLTVIMSAGALAIQLLVIGLLSAAIYGHWRWRKRIASVPFVFAMGVIFPIVVLSVLLLYGLILMQADPVATQAASSASGPTTTHSGEQHD